MKAYGKPPAAGPRPALLLWFCVVGPPIVWLVQFQVKITLASASPGSVSHGALIVVGMLSSLVVAGIGIVAGRQWRGAGASPLDVEAGVVERNRFMGMLGVMVSGLFLLLILAQIIADLLVPPGMP